MRFLHQTVTCTFFEVAVMSATLCLWQEDKAARVASFEMSEYMKLILHRRCCSCPGIQVHETVSAAGDKVGLSHQRGAGSLRACKAPVVMAPRKKLVSPVSRLVAFEKELSGNLATYLFTYLSYGAVTISCCSQ